MGSVNDNDNEFLCIHCDEPAELEEATVIHSELEGNLLRQKGAEHIIALVCSNCQRVESIQGDYRISNYNFIKYLGKKVKDMPFDARILHGNSY